MPTLVTIHRQLLLQGRMLRARCCQVNGPDAVGHRNRRGIGGWCSFCRSRLGQSLLQLLIASRQGTHLLKCQSTR